MLSLVSYQVSDLNNGRPVTLYWNPLCVHMTRCQSSHAYMNIVEFYVRLNESHIFHCIDNTIRASSQ